MSETIIKCKKCGKEITEGTYCKVCQAKRDKDMVEKGGAVLAALTIFAGVAQIAVKILLGGNDDGKV